MNSPSYDVWSLGINFVVYCSVLAIIVEAVVRTAPVFFKETLLGVRLIHGLPLLLGAVGSFLPSVIPDVLPGPKFFYGIIAGAFSGQVYAWAKQQFEAVEKVASKAAGKVLEAKINQGLALPAVTPSSAPSKPDEVLSGELKPSTESNNTAANSDEKPKSDVEPGLSVREG